MPRITPLQVAMGIGAAGAMVDVSSYVSFGDKISRDWGKQDEFRDAAPGTFAFTLFNQDGRFTPGNPSSPLTTTVTEGMPVCWNAGGRLVSGTILAIELPSDEASWGQVTITCDDMLGNAARRQLTSMAQDMVLGSTPYAYWPFNDAVGALVAAEQSGNNQPAMWAYPNAPAIPIFGVDAIPAVGQTQVDFAGPAGTLNYFASAPTLVAPFTTIPYAAGSMGCWGFWFTAMAAFPGFALDLTFIGLTNAISFLASSAMTLILGTSGGPISAPFIVGQPHYFSIAITTTGSTVITVAFYMDGVLQGTGNYTQTAAIGALSNAARTPRNVKLSVGDGSNATDYRISHLSHTATMANESYLGDATEANRLVALDQTTPEMVLDTLPADLSTALLGIQGASGTVLDALNAVIRAEQGFVYTATTGTLLAPVQMIEVRARQRPTTAITFDAATELSDVPQFVRDITNLVSSVTVTGPYGAVTVLDATLTGRVGSSNAGESVLNATVGDLALWGQDRLVRGKNVNLRAASITIDALTTVTDRSAALLALKPGDRISVINLPAATLGFTTWDGWLLGGSETHGLLVHTFQLFVSPVVPATAVFDTNLFMADGALTLSGGITNVATTMSVATTGPTLETVAVPYTLLLDAEQVTVTACTGATPQVATITRGVAGTTAVAHTTSATLEVFPPSLFAF